MGLPAVEGLEGADLGDYGVVPDLSSYFGFDFFGDLFLFWRVVKNNGAVLWAHIIALPVERRRVVGAEKYFQDLFIGNDRRIEFDLHHLGVFCHPGSYLLVVGGSFVAS